MRNINTASFVIFTLIAILITSCQPGTVQMKEGKWRGVFILPGNEIPFLFEVEGKSAANSSVFLINGNDRFELKKIIYDNDSVMIPVDLYDTALKGKLTKNTFEGRFIRNASDKKTSSIPFKAKFGELPRFPEGNPAPLVSLNGTWDINFTSPDNRDKTVGNFKQLGAKITGSILTSTGDYRFLEGVVNGKAFFLSTFGGSSPYLVKGEFSNDSTFSGEFINPRRTTQIEGMRNAKAALPDPYIASQLKEGHSTIAFTFPNLQGKAVSLTDPEYKGKVVIVTILGSWCPNCLDENAFLSEWYKTNHQRGIEIIGLGFERKNDFESAKTSLTNLKNRLGIQYEILFAGKSGTESASKALPDLNGISAFPTTIFIDKKGNVRKVHTGFSGPATGKFYEEFIIEFNGLINTLLSE